MVYSFLIGNLCLLRSNTGPYAETQYSKDTELPLSLQSDGIDQIRLDQSLTVKMKETLTLSIKLITEFLFSPHPFLELYDALLLLRLNATMALIPSGGKATTATATGAVRPNGGRQLVLSFYST